MARTLVWISGASSGIGAALAAAVPLPDPHVVDLSRRGGAPGVEHLPVDLADPAAWPVVAAHWAERLGGSGAEHAVFVHGAATLGPVGPAGVVDLGAYTSTVLLDAAAPQVLGAAWLASVADFPGRADLLLISSGAARTAYPGWSAYGAGKAAVDQWARCAGAEQAARAAAGRPSCRVVAVAPGVVDTPMQAAVRAADVADFPPVERFRQLHADGALRPAGDVAADLWALLDRDLEHGAVIDLRA